MAAWFVNLAGVSLIGLIVWWFWLYRPKAQRAAGLLPIEITVADGVYPPARIEIAAGKPVTLRFIRLDPSLCAEKALFDSLGVSTDLPVGKPLDVIVTPPQPGEYTSSPARCACTENADYEVDAPQLLFTQRPAFLALS